MLLSVTVTMAQTTKTITGTVVTEGSGQPLNNATLQAGPHKTLSQANGHFSLERVRTGDTLTVSYTGYKPYAILITAANHTGLLIRLQPLQKELAEVIVNTGYQAIAKERVTGSFEVISKDRFNEQSGTTVLERLEAIGSGLYVERKSNASAPRITIRGLSTIQGVREPLIILDNFPYEGSLDNLNPNDVESVTILKDAAAASIWGTRAGNGVIVITTKKGRFNQPLRVEINNNMSLAAKPDLDDVKYMDAGSFIEVEQFLYGKGFYNAQISSSSRPPLSPVVELLIKKANGSITAAQADAAFNLLRDKDIRNDYSRYMYRQTVNRQHSLSLKAGNANAAWSFAAGLDQNTGSLDEKYNRLTLKTDNSFKITKQLRLDAGMLYTQSNNTAGKTGIYDARASNGNLPVYTQLADADGYALPGLKNYRQAYLDTAGAGKLLDWNYYPLTDWQYVHNDRRLQEMLITAGLNFKPTRYLTALVNYQYERQAAMNATLYEQNSYYARNLINSFSQLNRTTGVVTYKVPKGDILSNSSSLSETHNIRAQLAYSNQWKRHELNAIAGWETRHVHSTDNSFTTYGYNSQILTYGNVDHLNAYPNFVTNSTSFISSGLGFNDRLNRYVSYFGNMAYTYRDRYSLSASARRDASNLFGVHTNDKWTPLWSAGVAWDMSKESFYRVKAIPFLRIKATYGVSGNADPSRSAVTTIRYVSTSPYTQLPTAMVQQFGNPGLRWENVYMLNLAVEFKTRNNRVQGSVEYYRKKATDLFGNTPVDYTAVGATGITQNVASMKGYGWDIALNSVNLKGAIGWTTHLNFSINKDRVTTYYKTSEQGSNFVGGGTSISAVAGRPVYAVYSYYWAGLDPQTGDPQGYFNGQVSKDYTSLTGTATQLKDLRYHGPAFPVVFGSLGNTVSYKGLSLTVRVSYKFGYYFRRNSLDYGALFSSRDGHPDYALRWQQAGNELHTHVPSMVYPAVARRDAFYRNSEVLVEKGDHIRLQYITLDYDLKKGIKKLPVLACNFYINANNLGILWRTNKHGIDPDYPNNTILPVRNIVAGLRLGL